MRVMVHDEGEETRSPKVQRASQLLHLDDKLAARTQNLSAPRTPPRSSLVLCWVSSIAISVSRRRSSRGSSRACTLWWWGWRVWWWWVESEPWRR